MVFLYGGGCVVGGSRLFALPRRGHPPASCAAWLVASPLSFAKGVSLPGRLLLFGPMFLWPSRRRLRLCSNWL